MEQADAGRLAATFSATLTDEWVRAGVTDVVVAPGSRSTPLAVAAVRRPGLRVHVIIDERSAAYVALGLGKVTGRPAVVVTTSGTAAVELHPAVVEAHHDAVPLICATADRPPELQGVGAPQTVDQTGLFGRVVRWSADPGPPDPAAAPTWRSLGSRAVLEASGTGARAPGPVHLNLAFREPLVGDPEPLPSGRPGGAPWHRRAAPSAVRLDDTDVATIAAALSAVPGVIVAGAGAGDPAAVHTLAATLGWPVFADPRSGARTPESTTIAYFDAILRAKGFAAEHAPGAVLRLGRLPASKVLSEWIAAAAPTEVVVDPTGAWVDPGRSATSFVGADPTDTCRRLAARFAGADRRPRPLAGWLGAWQQAESAAGAAIDDAVAAGHTPTEPGVAREALAAVPDGGTLVVSSSMPVRDVEWFGRPRRGIRVIANRGANGIDGVTSTAVGAALGSGQPTVLLTGDLAFLHDTNGLLGLAERSVDLTVVVVDNRGGGIFSFLPQASRLEHSEFETLFGTPHGVDLAALAAAHGLPVLSDIGAGVAAGGANVVIQRTDRHANVAAHDRLIDAVVRALDG